jgi:hypothetical protein
VSELLFVVSIGFKWNHSTLTLPLTVKTRDKNRVNNDLAILPPRLGHFDFSEGFDGLFPGRILAKWCRIDLILLAVTPGKIVKTPSKIGVPQHPQVRPPPTTQNHYFSPLLFILKIDYQ